MKLAIVIPTYNEAETIPRLIRELFEKIKQLVDKLDVLIIDDSSPDGTADIVRELGEKYEKITVIQRPKKMGLGAAYKEGFRHVLEKFDSELIVQMDADHSHQPGEIPYMLEKIKNFVKNNQDFLNSKKDFQIGVDGGISKETANIAVKAGADVLISGSSIFWHEDKSISECISEIIESIRDF